MIGPEGEGVRLPPPVPLYVHSQTVLLSIYTGQQKKTFIGMPGILHISGRLSTKYLY